MRVILTEMYFDRENLPYSDAPENPGIAFAWFRSDHDLRLRSTDVANITLPQGVSLQDFTTIEVQSDFEDKFGEFILCALSQKPFDPAIGAVVGSLPGLSPVVEAVLNSDIIVEQSPPSLWSVGGLTNRVTTVSAGTFIGVNAAGDQHTLLFLTVPFGIIVVGAAEGVSKALAAGLNKAIGRLFNSRRRRR